MLWTMIIQIIVLLEELQLDFPCLYQVVVKGYADHYAFHGMEFNDFLHKHYSKNSYFTTARFRTALFL